MEEGDEAAYAEKVPLHLLKDARAHYRVHCSRERSAIARRVLASTVWRAAARARVQLASTCPVTQEKDVYQPFVGVFERNTAAGQAGGQMQKRCSLCGKRFRTMAHLEHHLNARHAGSLVLNGTCLADFCDVLQCSLLAGSTEGRCDESWHEHARHRCVHEVVQPCFGNASRRDVRAAAVIREHLCNKLTCDARWQLYQRFHTEGQFTLSIAQAGIAIAALILAFVGLLLLVCAFGLLARHRRHERTVRTALLYVPGGHQLYTELKRRNIIKRPKLA